MGLIAKASGGDGFESVTPGLHQAVCYSVIDLGTHYNERFKKMIHEIRLGWEIMDERTKEDKPKAIFQKYNLSISKGSNLRKALEGWRGRPFTDEELTGFDMSKVVGTHCQIQSLNTEKDGATFSNVQNIVQFPKGMQKKMPENPTVYYSIMDHGTDIPESISDKVKEKIQSSEEWQEMNSGGMDERNHSVGSTAEDGDPGPSDEDSIPF